MKIHKLPQNVVNQIAAGEVIERPSSVVKELLDNSIDAKSTRIDIKIKNGGLTYIEISDNGTGIDSSDLLLAFESHATSKINSLEDLNKLLSLGFRGEALSTIQSVAKVTVTTKTEESVEASKLEIDNGQSGVIEKTARNKGTSVIVENLFSKIPARLKFLRTSENETKKIIDILIPYFLLHNEIHFTFEKDGKILYNLPQEQSQSKNFSINRLKNIIKQPFIEDLIPIEFNGEGIEISGYVSHPKHHSSKVSHQMIFLNGRNIKDNGIIRSVFQGFTGFIPPRQRVPFILSINLHPSLVDINVHPRKEEVRFLNPYRVYLAVEEAVKVSLEKNIKVNTSNTFTYNSDSDSNENAYNRLRNNNTNYSINEPSDILYKKDNSGRLREVSFKPGNRNISIEKSLKLSEELLSQDNKEEFNLDFLSKESDRSNIDINKIKSISQIFNKYICFTHDDYLFVIDQHAAAERINYEKLTQTFVNKKPEIQQLLTPESLIIDIPTKLLIEENIDVFKSLGFDFEIKKSEISISAIPSLLIKANIKELFVNSLKNEENFEMNSNKDITYIQNKIIATIACHSSIRTGQALSSEEIIYLIKELMKCTNQYSCPHGRPIIWKLSLTEIDKHFYRTY